MKILGAIRSKLSGNPFLLVDLLFVLFFIVAVLIKCIYFQATTGIMSKPFSAVVYRRMLLSSFCIIMIIASLLFFLFNKKRKLAFLIANIILTVILFSDTIYFRKYRTGLTVPVLLQIQFGSFGSIGDNARGLVKLLDILYILDLPFLIYAMIRLKKKLQDIGRLKIHILKRAIISVAGIAVFLGCFQLISKSVDHTAFIYDKNYAIKYLGIDYFHFYDVQSYINTRLLKNNSLSASQKKMITQYFKDKPKTLNTNYGVAKGKNLIIVQLESIEDFFINKELNGREITPRINELIKDSIYFSNFRYQIGGGNTSDAEFMCNNSLYPLREGSVYFRYPTNTYYSLPKLLKQQGYSADVFHAYKPSFWNRVEMYKALGFNNFYSEKSFKADNQVGMGLGDSSLFVQSLDKLKENKLGTPGKPFYAFMITLSSHFPYDAFENYDFDVGKYDGTTFGRYIRATNYVDKSIGILVDELKKRGLYDNTVLLIYGDHYGVPRYQSDELRDFLNISDSDLDWYKVQKVPCILHYTGLKKGETIDVTGGQVDLLPTLANIMGFKAPYAMGKDLLNTKNGYAVLRNGSFYTDSYFYQSDSTMAFDLDSQFPLKIDDYEAELKSHQNELLISDMIIQGDALRKLK